MDLLLRLITARKVFAFLLLLGAGTLLAPYGPKAYKAFMAWRYPPVAPDARASSASSDIAAEETRRRLLHVQALAAQADAVLAAARARGEDLSALDAKRREAARVAAADPRQAADLLNQIIAQTPGAPQGVLPLEKAEADEEEIEPDVPHRQTGESVASGPAPTGKKRRRSR